MTRPQPVVSATDVTEFLGQWVQLVVQSPPPPVEYGAAMDLLAYRTVHNGRLIGAIDEVRGNQNKGVPVSFFLFESFFQGVTVKWREKQTPIVTIEVLER